MFLLSIPAPLVLGVPTKTRLESSIKKFKPAVMIAFFPGHDRDSASGATPLASHAALPPPLTRRPGALNHTSNIAPLFQKGAESLDLRCVLRPAPSGTGAGCKTRRSRMKKFTQNPIVCMNMIGWSGTQPRRSAGGQGGEFHRHRRLPTHRAER